MKKIFALWGLVLATFLLASPADSQNALMAGDQPLEILADEGIEWRREERVYIARGNARAIQGDTQLSAAVLRAYYTEGADGSTGNIFRVEAEGSVVIKTPQQTVTGQKGVYDIAQGVMVLTGDNLKLETPTDIVTARDSLEYWQAKKLAVARGAAEVIRSAGENGGKNRIRADVLTAGLEPNAQGNDEIRVMDAYDNVEVITPCEYVRADRGRYLVLEQIAQMSGNVKITRGENQLNGDEAEVNLATGISKLKGERVSALLGGSEESRPGC